LVLLRYEPTDGSAVFFRVNLEVPEGELEIGIVIGAGETRFRQGHYYPLYRTPDLVHAAPDYSAAFTDNDYFTFGVEVFDIYAKFNGAEFVRFKDYRLMHSGSAAVKANQGYGVRKTTLRHKEPIELLSDY